MSDDTRLNHVLDAIDGALDDWSVSGDAMRWSPDPEPERQPAPTLPPPLPPGSEPARAPQWMLGMRVIEDAAVPPGEVWVTADAPNTDILRLSWAALPTPIIPEARVTPVLTADARERTLRLIADAFEVPVCIAVGHRWQDWQYLPTVLQYRRECERVDCHAIEAWSALLGRPS